MKLTIKTEGDCTIATVHAARIDAPSAVDFKEAMRAQTQGVKGRVLLDLSNVTFIDSSGLGAIVATMKMLAPDRKLVLAGFNPAVEKVFQLTRMDTVFEMFGTVDEAVNAERV
ncbi:MAG: STAS domain-containing protein [Pseudomonadota bacterium]